MHSQQAVNYSIVGKYESSKAEMSLVQFCRDYDVPGKYKANARFITLLDIPMKCVSGILIIAGTIGVTFCICQYKFRRANCPAASICCQNISNRYWTNAKAYETDW